MRPLSSYATCWLATAAILTAGVAAQSRINVCPGNLAPNGNFEAGNTGFTSSATYVAAGFLTTHQYSIRSAAVSGNPQWCQADHTTGTGNFLVCDGAATATTVAWSRVIATSLGSSYDVRAYVANVMCTQNFADPILAIRVNGTVIAGPLVLPETPDVWAELAGSFVATTANATVEIISTSLAAVGNDFAIDDICVSRKPNLVKNGTFSLGNVGFTSSATFVAAGILGSGQYTVRANPATANGAWCGTDHTTGTGNMLLCDGAATGTTIAWSQTRAVCPGVPYVFNAWVNNILCVSRNFADPRLELRVDNVPIAGLTLPEIPDAWVQMSGSFTPTVPSVTLTIVSIAPAAVGNDFAIDDIALCCPEDLVTNGDFDAGNTGFTSALTFVPTALLASGQYSVRANPATGNGAWCGVDHTTGGTNMLICDGFGSGITTAWSQTVPVCRRVYRFSAWVNNLVCPNRNFTDPLIELYVNSTKIAGVVLPEIPDQWVRVSGTWLGPVVPGTAVVSIVAAAASGAGNDFAIDDISFTDCVPTVGVVRFGDPANPFGLDVVDLPALGGVWSPALLSFLPGSVVDGLVISFSVPLNLPTPFGTLLCDAGPALALITTTNAGGSFAIPIPLEPTLLDVNLIAQGFSASPTTVRLCNAIDLQLGGM